MNSVIDKNIAYVLRLITGLNETEIYNYYDIKGANPQKIVVNDEGKKELIPYSPKKDTFIMFGVEEVEDANSNYIVTPTTGGEEDTITVTQRLKVVVEINGKNAQAYALQIKALMWRWDVMDYFENNKISIITQNPEIQFMNEIVNEEFWERRGFTFEVAVELNYDTSSMPELEGVSNIIVKDVENIEEENND